MTIPAWSRGGIRFQERGIGEPAHAGVVCAPELPGAVPPRRPGLGAARRRGGRPRREPGRAPARRAAPPLQAAALPGQQGHAPLRPPLRERGVPRAAGGARRARPEGARLLARPRLLPSRLGRGAVPARRLAGREAALLLRILLP